MNKDKLRIVESPGNLHAKSFWYGEIELGRFEMDVDGFWKFWISQSRSGYLNEFDLRLIANELEKLNADWNKQINDYFERQAPEGIQSATFLNTPTDAGSPTAGESGEGDIRSGIHAKSFLQRMFGCCSTLWAINWRRNRKGEASQSSRKGLTS